MSANERPEHAVANVMFDLTPSLRVNVWLTGDVDLDAASLGRASQAIRKWLGADAKTRLALGILTDEEKAQRGAARQERRAEQRRPREDRGQRPRSGGQSAGTGVYCPEHDVEMRKTDPKYDREGDSFYHPYPPGEYGPQGGKNHTLYFRLTVDANGESNEGREMPAAQRQRTAAGRRDDDYPEDDPDDLPF